MKSSKTAAGAQAKPELSGEALLQYYAEKGAQARNTEEHIPGCSCCTGHTR